jgi:hypothetical protein
MEGRKVAISGSLITEQRSSERGYGYIKCIGIMRFEQAATVVKKGLKEKEVRKKRESSVCVVSN